jgi:hypothetical protein
MSRISPISTITMLPSSATAAAAKTAASGAATGHAAETGRTLLVILRPVFGGEVLADDDRLAFFQVAFDHFRRRAVGDAELDHARLWFVVGAEHPDDASPNFLERRGRWREAIVRSVGASARPGSPGAGRRPLLAACQLGAGLIASVSPRAPFSAARAVRTAVASASPTASLASA